MRFDFSPYLVIARSTFREIIRERLLYGILLVATLVTASSFFMATISFDQSSRVLENVGLASIQLFTVFIMIFVTTNSVYKDLERRVLYLLFPKPISRSEYVIGKYFGLLMVLATTLLILGGMYILALIGFDRTIITPVFSVLCYTFLEVGLVIGIAQLFASFTAPLNASLYTIGLYIIGHALPTLKQFAERNSGAATQHLLDVCYYILPNFEKFDFKPAALYRLPVPGQQVFWAIFYGVIYICVVVYLTILVMRKREV